MHFFTTLIWLPAATWALRVTSPTKETRWDASKDQVVQFESVSTDPTSVSIVIVNQHIYPPTSMVVGSQVDTSTGTFDIPADKLLGLNKGDGYQVNLISTTNDGILAQSGTFVLDASISNTPVEPTDASSTSVKAVGEGAPTSHVQAEGAPSTTVSSGESTLPGTPASQAVSGSASSVAASPNISVTPNAAAASLSNAVLTLASVLLTAMVWLL